MLPARCGWKEVADSYLTRVQGGGLVSMGRTSTPELALLPTTEPEAYGPTRNPWNLEHSRWLERRVGGGGGGRHRRRGARERRRGIDPRPASVWARRVETDARAELVRAVARRRWSSFSAEFTVTRSVRGAAALLDAALVRCPAMPRPTAASGCGRGQVRRQASCASGSWKSLDRSAPVRRRRRRDSRARSLGHRRSRIPRRR
jgi:hypothetical protein